METSQGSKITKETSLNKKKVEKFLVIGQLPPPYHGSNVMTETFCKSLEEIGYKIEVVERSFSKKMEEVEKTSFRKILKIPLIGIALYRKILTFRPRACFYFISAKPPSVYVDILFLSIIFLMRFQAVLYFHGKGYSNRFRKKSKLKKFLFLKFFSLSHGGITLGNNIIGDVQWFLRNKKIIVIPNCILTPTKRNRKSTDKNFAQILFLSNLLESKGPIQFLKVASSINKIKKNVKFVLAGSFGNIFLMKKIFDFIRKEKLESYVSLPGAVYGIEKEKLFFESDIFLFPTYYDLECFPLVILEAMDAGLPVITSFEGCIPEIIQNGVCGYLIEPNNIPEMTKKAITLIENEGLRRNMGLKGKEIFDSKFSYKQYKKNLVNAIEQILP